MPLEIAFIPVAEPNAKAFERAATIAFAEVFPAAPGFVRGEVRKGVERAGWYVLLLEWERIEDHTESFVNSDGFARWVELTDGLISGEPLVEHWSLVDLD